LLPGIPVILEVPDLFLFLGIHADNRIASGGKFAPLPIDVFELSVAHFSRWRVFVARFQAFVIDAQRETHFTQQAANGLGTDLDMNSAQLPGDLLGRLPRPFQMVHRIAAGFMFQQFCDSFDYCGRFFPRPCARRPHYGYAPVSPGR
jgi:hypothetical protein